MQKHLDTSDNVETARSRFSRLYLIRPEGRIFCSPEQSKLCFEAPETRLVPKTTCPCRELENTLRSRGFCGIVKYWPLRLQADRLNKWISYERKQQQ